MSRLKLTPTIILENSFATQIMQHRVLRCRDGRQLYNVYQVLSNGQGWSIAAPCLKPGSQRRQARAGSAKDQGQDLLLL